MRKSTSSLLPPYATLVFKDAAHVSQVAKKIIFAGELTFPQLPNSPLALSAPQGTAYHAESTYFLHILQWLYWTSFLHMLSAERDVGDLVRLLVSR